jgi:hypothetical protein
MATLKETLEMVRKNTRICPQPDKWNELYKLLPNRNMVNGGWEQALPFILAAWWDTSGIIKQIRLKAHIERANEHECLDVVCRYLECLSEKDWFHVGE